MQRVHHKYTEWEDYQNGMFSRFKSSDKDKLIQKGVELLSNENMFLYACNKVIKEWKISSEENLTNNSCNKRSWLGQASCCIIFGVPETLTRISWSLLTEDQRVKANIIAEKVIISYEINYRNIREGVGEQMLLQWDS